jgi:hypothetical protein
MRTSLRRSFGGPSCHDAFSRTVVRCSSSTLGIFRPSSKHVNWLSTVRASTRSDRRGSYLYQRLCGGGAFRTSDVVSGNYRGNTMLLLCCSCPVLANAVFFKFPECRILPDINSLNHTRKSCRRGGLFSFRWIFCFRREVPLPARILAGQCRGFPSRRTSSKPTGPQAAPGAPHRGSQARDALRVGRH